MILRVISYLLYLLIFGAVFVLILDTIEPAELSRGPAICSEPVTYHIAGIDEQFDITREELKVLIDNSGRFWSNAAGRNLWEYDSQGDVAVYLIYDERQQLVEAEQGLSQQIQTQRMQFDRLYRDFHQQKEAHEEAQTAYRNRLSDYQSRVESHNREVEEWNEQGGAPSDVKHQLEERQRLLEKEQTELLNIQNEVNRTAERVQSVTQRINKIHERKNELIDDYNNRFAREYRFNQGEYITRGNERRINIYHFQSRIHLQRVLTHEIGHALGLGHLERPGSIMYPVVESGSVRDVQLSDEDLRAIQQLCNRVTRGSD